MSFGLGRGRPLDDAPGAIGVTRDEFPVMPDEAIATPALGHINPRAWFKQPDRPLELEIGSGKGSFILGHAAANPGTNMLGIEWAREFYLYAADRIRRRSLPNVRMLHTDATEFLRWRCPDNLFAVIHLYYSDPWPKAKHHKNRVIQDRFLADARRVLAPGGELRVVTDHVELWDWCEDHFARATASGLWARRDFAAPDWTDDDEVVGTNYERKTRAEGREPKSCVLVRVG